MVLLQLLCKHAGPDEVGNLVWMTLPAVDGEHRTTILPIIVFSWDNNRPCLSGSFFSDFGYFIAGSAVVRILVQHECDNWRQARFLDETVHLRQVACKTLFIAAKTT